MAVEEREQRGGARPLGEREGQILRAIVEDFIRTGEPVGSQSVAPRCEVSSATVRSVMGELESLGLLEKPHASAGRRPTDAGYRYYVDALLTVGEPLSEDRRLIDEGLGGGSLGPGLQEASRLLHALSRHAGVVATTRSESTRLRQIDLLRLGDGKILAVVVTEEGRVLNKLLSLERPPTTEDLGRVTRALNQLLGEGTVEELRERLAREIAQKRALCDELLGQALGLVQRVLAEEARPELLLSGQSTLLAGRDVDLGRIRSILEAIEDGTILLGILEQAVTARSLQIFIGAESPLGEGAGVALVAAPYAVAGQLLGAVGVIGPTRMDYSRVIPLVDYTARTVSRILAER